MSTPQRILLVDDDLNLTAVFSRFIRAAGYEVKVVNSAIEAVPAAVDFRPSLILLDAKLQDGDGRDILASIRATSGIESTRIAFLSGCHISLAELDELTWYVAKPIRLRELLDAIQHMLTCESRRPGGE